MVEPMNSEERAFWDQAFCASLPVTAKGCGKSDRISRDDAPQFSVIAARELADLALIERQKRMKKKRFWQWLKKTN